VQYRKLGQSDIEVPVVSFGAWAIGGWMWGGTDDRDAVRAIHAAIDCGITCIDTAPAYGMGHSEKVVGEAIRGCRDKVVVATKCGLRWNLAEGEKYFPTETPESEKVTMYKNLKPDSIRHECEQSLRRLRVDCIDLYQCHWPDSTTDLDDTMSALLALQQEGKVRAIGVSNFSADQMRKCLASGRIESDQPKYNAIDRDIEPEVLPFCIEHQVSVLAYSPIAQGLLTGRVTLDREFPPGDLRRESPKFKPENRAKVLDMLEKVRPIAQGYDATLAQFFTAWLIAQPGVTTALVGARNAPQAEENAKAGELNLSEADVRLAREAVEAMGPLT
jgi:aryl-alcohol dehydrogenase-like predicted oxidoreductase